MFSAASPTTNSCAKLTRIPRNNRFDFEQCPQVNKKAFGGETLRERKTPMPKELAHLRALPLCMLKFVYTSGFGKIYCVELCNINLQGKSSFISLHVSHDDADGVSGEADHTADWRCYQQSIHRHRV